MVILPGIAEDVASLLKWFSTTGSNLVFAVKGGGHIAVPGFNSTTGVLIDLMQFNHINYIQATTFVDVGPGQNWDAVSTYLITWYGVNVNGATTCSGVGVAGFNLGGGYGNKTNQFGLAIDNIQSMVVALPTGDIVTADETNNKDLFWALKGGGNNFGIVLNWTLSTHPQEPKIYSQHLTYAPEYFERLVNAIMHFTQHEVPKSNIEVVFEYTFDSSTKEPKPAAKAELFYDGEVPPPGLFDEFLAIPHLWERLDTTWQDRMDNLPRNHQTFTVGLPSGEDDLPKFRGRFSSVMVSHYTAHLIMFAINQAGAVAREFACRGGLQVYVDIWPFLSTIFDHSPPAAWPHTKGHSSGPLVINCKWEGEGNDAFWLPTIEKVTAQIRKVALHEGCTTPKAAQYYNLSLDNVTTSDIYQGHLARLKDLRHKYDPKEVMNRTGGFRI